MDANSTRPASVAAATSQPSGTIPPAPVLHAVLQEGLSRSRSGIKMGGSSIAGEIDWTAVCAVAHRLRIAPIVYQSLRSSSLPVPRDVMEWFRVQHYNTVARNLASLSTLRSVLGMFSGAGIPVLVFKGPALAEIGHGMARSWKDLDLLISSGAIERAEMLLLEAGYHLLPDPPHPNHRRYASSGDASQSVIEVHFNISDPLRAYRPDVPMIWARAAETKVLGVSALVPDLADHLLLTIMQLPHHHWSVRLLLDVWQVIARHHEALNWSDFFARADAWGMTALTRSALSVLTVTFGATLPGPARLWAHPAGYYDRLRREIASRSVIEQFEYPFHPKVMWIAPFVVAERPGRAVRILMRRLLGGGELMEDGRIETALRRNLKSMEVLPAVFRAFAASLLPSQK